jgi:benzoyl-CoA reductase/2-hydroxyglutaryl-CoA dehydratase subunit BcrC/BadD/HgdB
LKYCDRGIEMLKTVLTEIKRRAADALSNKEDAGARWPYEWSDLFLRAYEGQKPVVFTSLYAFPMEILYAADVAPFDFEVTASILLTLDMGTDLLADAEDRGYSPDICSFHRGAFGTYVKDYFPNPELLITTSFYCDGKAKISEVLSRLYHKPSFLLDVPHEINTESIRYVEKQLRDVAGKVAALTGKPFDEDCLRETAKNSNRARGSHQKLLDILAHRPCPWGGLQLINYSILSHMLDGSPKLADIHEGYLQKLLERIEAGKTRPERHRVFWYAWPPTYKTTIFDTLTQHEVSIPVCETFLIYDDEIDEKNPFRSLALRCLKNPFIGKTERRTDTLHQVIDTYGIDGVILFATPACRHSKGNFSLMKDAVNSYGLPFLLLDVDIGDPRGYSTEQVRTRIEAFVELMDTRNK